MMTGVLVDGYFQKKGNQGFHRLLRKLGRSPRCCIKPDSPESLPIESNRQLLSAVR
jgi:hypothetical protein